MWKCPRCGNIDQKYIYYINNVPYCRRCINFKKKVAPISPKIKPLSVIPNLNYKLSNEQIDISNKLIKNYCNKQNTLVQAVCGAGKTEIILEVICLALSKGNRVGIIIPRKQVVIEIQIRLETIFPTLRVTAVYGGHNQQLDGDIVILTAHQSYLYANKFGLVIVDEIDAFPYYGNNTLKAFVERTSNDVFIYLSATPPDEYQKNKVVTLNKRYHNCPLPVPTIIRIGNVSQLLWLYNKLRKFNSENKQCFVYVPTIDLCAKLYRLYFLLIPGCYLFHSKLNKKELVIAKFKNQEYKVLFTTTILERGVTFPNIQVIVLRSDHLLFNQNNLVQIAGRVGRNIKYPTGEVYFLSAKITYEMKEAVNKIKEANLLI